LASLRLSGCDANSTLTASLWETRDLAGPFGQPRQQAGEKAVQPGALIGA